jgi:hypothetical protein
MTRQILAAYDDEGVYVYQAFRPSIVEAAVKKGTFGKGFGMDRMTWIKPSFGWMLHRSGYATKSRQEAIAKVKITHEGFLRALSQSVLTLWNPDVHPSQDDWRAAMKANPVRVQWDPDRALTGMKLERRAIQIGLNGQTVYDYVNEWIIEVEDVTALAHAIKHAKDHRQPFPPVPEERVYPVDAAIAHRLGITE